MLYAAGDLILYGETGVCRVTAIEERSFLGAITSCYRLEPLYQSCVIYTPADNGNIYMRPIISKERAENLINGIKQIIPPVITHSSPRELTEKYDKIIKLHDCDELVLLIASIYAKRSRLTAEKKKLSAIDERFLKKAEDLLFGELAAALDIEKSQVIGYIEERF